MAVPLSDFKKNCRKCTDPRAIKSRYACLVGDPNQTPRVKEKLQWMQQEYPWLVDGGPAPSEPDTSTECERPYHVDVAEKYLQLYRSATKRSKDFNLELKDVHNLLQAKRCFYTGEVFAKSGDMSRTVDRIDNAKGYVKGNVVACTHLANQTKAQIFERPTMDAKMNIQFIARVAKVVIEKTGGEA